MSKQLRKFLLFEWLIFIIVGCFWSAAMYVTLLINKYVVNKDMLWLNMLIMFGPYLLYFVIRSIYLLYRSLRWSYLVSNYLFRSEMERCLADEWFLFALLFIFWSLVIAFPLYWTSMFSSDLWPFALGIMAAPYAACLLWRVIILFFVALSKRWTGK